MREYFQRLPRVKYANGEVVLAALQSDEEGDTDEDEPPGSTTSADSDFNKICQRAVLKCIPRGRRLVRAGYVLSVLDCLRGPHYFVKAQVKASMEQELRSPTTTIVKDTGDVLTATCTCKARELQRCGHIAALHCLLLRHIDISGREGTYGTIFSDKSSTWKVCSKSTHHFLYNLEPEGGGTTRVGN